MLKDVINNLTRELTKIPAPPKSRCRVILKEMYDIGRMSILEEWKEEQRKFEKGFNYRKNE